MRTSPTRCATAGGESSIGAAGHYNAAADLIGRGLRIAGDDKVACIDHAGFHTYGELAASIKRFAALTRRLGLPMESRLLLCLADSVDFHVTFLGAIWAGLVPVPVNPLLTRNDLAFMLGDSRARALVVSETVWPKFASWVDAEPFLEHVIIGGRSCGGRPSLAQLLAAQAPAEEPAPTVEDEVCFWLYTSGSTGRPKAAVHVHRSLALTAELFGRGVLGIGECDVVFSASKLCFAFGLGNALTFPLSAGATAVLMAERPTPAGVARVLRAHRPTLFFAVPTLYAAMLASGVLPPMEELGLRVCVSSGEALPAELGRRWQQAVGVPLLDAVGSTEMLHTFLSNRPDDMRYGTSGRPVPGYDIRVVDERGRAVASGTIGELHVRGPTAAAQYWNRRDRSRATFLGEWTRSGDKYVVTGDGYYCCCGRSDDMLKVAGNFVSPLEVETALCAHDAVLEAAVVGHPDANGLTKPRAFVVLKPGIAATDDLAGALQSHVKQMLAPYKYPRWIEFLPELPRTATGKVQRYKLRELPVAGKTPAHEGGGQAAA